MGEEYQVREATISEVKELERLINAAYRGGEGGWTGMNHFYFFVVFISFVFVFVHSPH